MQHKIKAGDMVRIKCPSQLWPDRIYIATFDGRSYGIEGFDFDVDISDFRLDSIFLVNKILSNYSI